MFQPVDTFGLDVSFYAEQAGLYTCDLLLSANSDVRTFRIECEVHQQPSNVIMNFHSPANTPLTQSIPIVSWRCRFFVVFQSF